MVPTPLTESQLPPCLSELPSLPRVLHLCGLIPTRPMVAIVGTRRPSLEAMLFAEKLAKDLIAHGFAVASGGAAGIDSAAHRGALQANGQTLVVAPSGWYSPYPAINQPLFEQIVASDGGYLSLVDPYCKPGREAFKIALNVAGESDPSKCVMIDDLPHTMHAAKDFGLYAVLYGSELPNRFGAAALGLDMDAAFTDWSQLPALLNESRSSIPLARAGMSKKKD